MRPTTINSTGNWIRALTAIFLACSALTAVAQSLPVARLFSVFPPGAKQGASVDVAITGVDLEDVSQLHFSTPGITATQKTVAPGLGEATPQPAHAQVLEGHECPCDGTSVRCAGIVRSPGAGPAYGRIDALRARHAHRSVR